MLPLFQYGLPRRRNQQLYAPHPVGLRIVQKGFTFGRDVTTFCDLNAAPNTIDFQGPNAYNYFFSTMIRYEHSIYRDILKFGVAAELPNVSGTYGGDSFASIPQRVPDFPVYMQVNGAGTRRAISGHRPFFRDMYLHNESTGNNTSLFGWGVQASGNIKAKIYRASDWILRPILTIRVSIQTCRCTVGRRLRKSTLVPNKPRHFGGHSMAELCRRNAYADARIPVAVSMVLRQYFLPIWLVVSLRPNTVRHPRKHGRNEGPRQSGQSDGALQLLISEGGIPLRACRMQPSVIFGFCGRCESAEMLLDCRGEKRCQFHYSYRWKVSQNTVLGKHVLRTDSRVLERPISEFLPIS